MKELTPIAISAALISVFALAACAKKDAITVDTSTASSVVPAGAASTTAIAARSGLLSDANIVYLLDHANMLDSSAGSVAVQKGTSADIREFGRMMMRDHHSLRLGGQALANKLAITPAPPANDDTNAQTDRTMTLLSGATKGRDFDKAYIENEVMFKKALLETVTAGMNAAQNAELKNLIQKAAPTILAHLDSAQAIQRQVK